MKTQKIVLNSGLVSLIGFARRSHNLESGFEAVRRGIEKRKIAFVLVDESLAENSFKKIISIARRFDTLVLIAQKSEDTNLRDTMGYKILGIHQGELAKGFIDKLKQENQWL